MYSFKNDYSEGAHPRIMQALLDTNLEQTDGYGTDPHCERARALIREKIACPEADVHFLVGGTQANLTVVAAALRPYQAVVAAHTGHVCVHETGAIEATGHKVVSMPSPDGRLTPAMVEEACGLHTDEHMVQPKMVYISDSTEVGTLYRKAELEALHDTCRALGLYLFLDGARLSAALTAETNDLSLPDLARLCDVFYLGGTKCGALFGEAVVIVNDALKPDFRYLIKQRGGMLAKGRLLGIQFESLFEDGLYLELGARANRLGMRMKRAISESGFSFASDSYTNQQFAVLPDALVEALGGHYKFERNGKPDAGHTVVRFVTSWATDETAGRAVRRRPAAAGERGGMTAQPKGRLQSAGAVVPLAVLATFLWGTAFPCVKLGYRLFAIESGGTASQMLFAGTRFLLAGALTLAFGAAAGRRAPLPARRNYGGVLLLGLVQTTAQYVFFYVGLANTTAAAARSSTRPPPSSASSSPTFSAGGTA